MSSGVVMNAMKRTFTDVMNARFRFWFLCFGFVWHGDMVESMTSTKKAQALSIVIPVYNDQSHLKMCLDSIKEQTILPSEVIVVDNNSQDNSIKIAKSYPFVRVVKEPVQGIFAARTTGFNAAKSSLIGRIDADSRLDKYWVQTVLDYYHAHPDVDAITGDCMFYNAPAKKIVQAVHHFVYYTVHGLIAGTTVLWGSNMVLTKKAWQAVEPIGNPHNPGHEDIQLTLDLQKSGFSIRRVKALKAHVSLRRGELQFMSLARYTARWPKTYWYEGYEFKSLIIWVIVVLLIVIFSPITLTSSLLALVKK